MFRALDHDGSGTLSIDEIKGFMNGTSLKLDDASFDEVFADLLKPQEGSEFNDDSV